MKVKFIFAILCLAMLTFVCSGCNPNTNNGDGSDDCIHSYTDGVCAHCGGVDPDYNGGTNNGEGQNPGDEDDNSNIPPIDFGSETDLPFVPAK